MGRFPCGGCRRAVDAEYVLRHERRAGMVVQKLLEQWTPENKRRRRQFDSESRVIPLIGVA
ncbi:hypothetical protein [Kibdelosporangium aridum]|uniref:hypothetical protein n=1 Tax=Kibdelosporangium aridum TaxID=2030 RepID=UPI0035E73812